MKEEALQRLIKVSADKSKLQSCLPLSTLIQREDSVMDKCLIFITVLLKICEASDSYSAVVVEYSPPLDASVDGLTNILNNVNVYVEIINKAKKSQFSADIIVFPEAGLKGIGNQGYFLEIPEPKDKITLCASNTTYEADFQPLVQLSCAARSAHAYVVVNLGEKYVNTSQQRTLYFNTNIVFDNTGAVIARYRKIHLFAEGMKEPSPDRELVYFDTEFGVRFGIFTCFDIVFEDPGVVLAKEYNITHFIFVSGWMSQLPFLVATQQQWYWAYTQDVVLLASGHNLPSIGASGTGVYLGRDGPLIYRMVETRQTFMLHANVPKNYKSSGGKLQETRNPKSKTNNFFQLGDSPSNKLNMEQNSGSQEIKLKHEDFINIYSSKLIVPEIPKKYLQKVSDGLERIDVPVIVEEEICQNSICCQFSVNITAVFYNFKQTSDNVTRGDDYSQLYYRLAVFDGVRHYDHIATGGLQTCAIISCVNRDISSCGLKSDDPSAQKNIINDLEQTQFIFNSITIVGNFSKNSSFIGPNVLLGGEGDSYGSLLSSDSFVFREVGSDATADTEIKSFQTLPPIRNLVTASLYGRLFLRDGLPSSDKTTEQNSSRFNLIDIVLLLAATIMIKFGQ